MGKTILEEAMADAKILKETAIENAKNVLVEAISPKIKEFVDNQLGEGDLDENEFSFSPVTEVEDEPPVEDEGEGELDLDMDEGMYEAADNDEEEKDDIEEVVEITNEDLRQAMSEIMKGDVSEAMVSKGFGDVEDPTPKNAGGKQQTGIADEKGGESHWAEEEASDSEDWTVKESAYRKKLSSFSRLGKKLQRENKELREVCSFLKRNLQEVNLFNNKLLYTNKVIQGTGLNNKQRLSVIEAFDKAASLREVELVYNSLSESLKIAGVMSEGKVKKPVRGKSPTRRVGTSGTSRTLNESVDRESGQESWAERQQKLSGLV